MYNQEYKEAFIKTEYSVDDKYINTIITRFNKIAPYEENLGKDLSNFSIKEISEFYSSLMYRSVENLENFNLLFGRYTRYMLSQNLVSDSQNHYDEFDIAMLMKCLDYSTIAGKIITREELESEIKELLNPCDQFLLLALFEGICGQGYSDFWELEFSNFEGNIVHLPGRDLEVSSKLVNLAEKSSEEYEYIVFGDKEYIRHLKEDDHRILKDKLGNKVDADDITKIQRVRTRIAIIKKNLDNKSWCASKNLIESGRIDMIKKIMIRENINNLEDLLLNKKIRQEIKYRYGELTNNSISRYVLKYGKYFN